MMIRYKIKKQSKYKSKIKFEKKNKIKSILFYTIIAIRALPFYAPSHSEPLRATPNHSEPLRTTPSHSEPLRATPTHFHYIKIHSEPLRPIFIV